jgi:hypothetical protein
MTKAAVPVAETNATGAQVVKVYMMNHPEMVDRFTIVPITQVVGIFYSVA